MPTGHFSQAELAGQRFGYLVAVERAPNGSRGHAMWQCVCVCGRTCSKRAVDLEGKAAISCGCRSERGKPKTKIKTSSRFKGVTYVSRRKKWQAACGGTYVYFGDNEIDAAIAYDKKAVALWGDEAATNQRLGLYPWQKSKVAT